MVRGRRSAALPICRQVSLDVAGAGSLCHDRLPLCGESAVSSTAHEKTSSFNGESKATGSAQSHDKSNGTQSPSACR